MRYTILFTDSVQPQAGIMSATIETSGIYAAVEKAHEMLPHTATIFAVVETDHPAVLDQKHTLAITKS